MLYVFQCNYSALPVPCSTAVLKPKFALRRSPFFVNYWNIDFSRKHLWKQELNLAVDFQGGTIINRFNVLENLIMGCIICMKSYSFLISVWLEIPNDELVSEWKEMLIQHVRWSKSAISHLCNEENVNFLAFGVYV